MGKEKIKLKDIIEEEEEVQKDKKKHGLIAEEIEEIEEKKETDENDEDFDEEEFEEEIEDFVPRTQPIKLESKIEGIFPKREEQEEEEKEDNSKEKHPEESERQYGNPVEEMIKKFSGKRIESPDILKEGKRIRLDIGFRKGELRAFEKEFDERGMMKLLRKRITERAEVSPEGFEKSGEDFEYSSEDTKGYSSEKAESKAEAKESSSSDKTQ